MMTQPGSPDRVGGCMSPLIQSLPGFGIEALVSCVVGTACLSCSQVVNYISEVWVVRPVLEHVLLGQAICRHAHPLYSARQPRIDSE